MVFLMYNIQLDTAKYLYLIEERDKIQCLRGTASINQLNTAFQAVLDPIVNHKYCTLVF